MKKFFLLCVCAGVLLSCNKSEDPALETDVDRIEATSDGGNFNVKVSCNVATDTEITYESGDGWIFLMPKVLKGNGTLLFQISKFLDYDATRTATATISGDGVKKTIVISQTGRPKPVATDLDLSVYNIYADVEGVETTVSVSTAGEWTAVSDADWCKVENGSAIGIGEFKVKVEESTDYKYRTANVKVKAGSLERTVFVQHVGTKIGDVVWANSNVDDPDTFGKNCQVRGKLYQWNAKVGYPSYSANDKGDTETVVPGFVGGAKDVHSETWTEENDPCPEGWRVPTKSEFETLLAIDQATPKFWFDYWMANGMSVAGAYVGLDRELMKSECGPGNLNGAIFIPQAGLINRDSCKQEDWWDAALWTATNVGQTWDMWGLWMNGNGDYGFSWYGSASGLSVRCVLKTE